MIRVKKPSRQAMLTACQLGQQMARLERHLRPVLRDVALYQTFAQFRIAHRALLEGRPAFANWDRQLQRKSEREAARMGFDLDRNVKAWDAFITFVHAPMKEAFWRGWEAQSRLAEIYQKKRQACLDTTTDEVTVLRTSELVPILPDLTADKMSETQRWDELSKALFGSTNGIGASPQAEPDDAFWEINDPSEVAPVTPSATDEPPPPTDLPPARPGSAAMTALLDTHPEDLDDDALAQLDDAQAALAALDGDGANIPRSPDITGPVVDPPGLRRVILPVNDGPDLPDASADDILAGLEGARYGDRKIPTPRSPVRAS